MNTDSNVVANDRVYGELEFDRRAVGRYWFVSVMIGCVVAALVSFGFLLPLLLLWALGGYWLINKEFQRRRYEVDDDSVNVYTGVLFHQEKVIPLEKITDIKLYQGPLMRAFGVYMLWIQTAGTGNGMPEVIMTFESRTKAREVRERIMTARRNFRAGLATAYSGDE